MQTSCQNHIDRDGYLLLRRVYTDNEIRLATEKLTARLHGITRSSASIRSRGGRVYAARNFIDLFPNLANIWKQKRLIDLLTEVLGSDGGLVRGLYFDKPPEQSWSLPWHKDLTISVQDNQMVSAQFTNPTRKAGIPHVEAPKSILDSMLTLRIHLDDATEENGALQVIAGSHLYGRGEVGSVNDATIVAARAGDVLAMRPLLSHCSGNSQPGTTRHRRVIHLEFASRRQLPDGFQWHHFQQFPTSVVER